MTRPMALGFSEDDLKAWMRLWPSTGSPKSSLIWIKQSLRRTVIILSLHGVHEGRALFLASINIAMQIKMVRIRLVKLPSRGFK